MTKELSILLSRRDALDAQIRDARRQALVRVRELLASAEALMQENELTLADLSARDGALLGAFALHMKDRPGRKGIAGTVKSSATLPVRCDGVKGADAFDEAALAVNAYELPDSDRDAILGSKGAYKRVGRVTAAPGPTVSPVLARVTDSASSTLDAEVPPADAAVEPDPGYDRQEGIRLLKLFEAAGIIASSDPAQRVAAFERGLELEGHVIQRTPPKA